MKKFFVIILCPLLIIVLTCTCTKKSRQTIELEADTEAEAEEVEQEIPIDHSWQFDSPENRGFDLEGLSRFHAALDEHEIYSVLMVKDGFIVDEYFRDGYNEDSVLGLTSVSKSITGAVIGLAIEHGFIESVDVPISEFLPQLDEPGMEGKRGITIEQLLTHKSGIYWSEWAGGDYEVRMQRSANWLDFVLGQNMQYEPGKVFNYTTGGIHLLGAVVQYAVGVSEYEFAREYLFEPLGMDSCVWDSDPQGFTDAGNGLYMTARDAAKFGQLYLDGGRYKEKQIINEDWIQRSISFQTSTGSPNSGNYGYCWWLKSFGGYDGYYGMGAGGQYIIVVPPLNLVVVMFCNIKNTYTPQNLFRDYVNIMLPD